MISFFLPKPATSISEYVDLLSAHGSYWTDPSFAAFLLTEVFANPASSTADSVKAGTYTLSDARCGPCYLSTDD